MECFWVNVIILNCYSTATEQRAAVRRWLSHRPRTYLVRADMNCGGSRKPSGADSQRSKSPLTLMKNGALGCPENGPHLHPRHPSIFIYPHVPAQGHTALEPFPVLTSRGRKYSGNSGISSSSLTCMTFSYWVKLKSNNDTAQMSSEGALKAVVLNLSRNKWLYNR